MSSAQTDADRVCELLRSYRQVDAVHPVLREMLRKPEYERMFWNILSHDLNVIRQRSQDLADSEITITQKALGILVEDKYYANAAMQLYVDEILGLGIVSERQKSQKFIAIIQTREHIMHHITSSAPSQGDPAYLTPSTFGRRLSGPTFDTSDAQATTEDPVTISDSNVRNVQPNPTKDVKAMPEKLLITYKEAKAEFDALPGKSLERTKSAKFLRDTTENCLSYLETRGSLPPGDTSNDGVILVSEDSKIVDEMKLTLQTAIKAAEEGSGGKKRRFDDDWTNVPQGPATMRSPAASQPEGTRDPVPRGTTDENRFGRHHVTGPDKKHRPAQDTEWVEHHRPRLTERPRFARPVVPAPRTPPRSTPRPLVTPSPNRRRITQIDRTPRGLVPASAGQGRRRVFPMPKPGFSDRYRSSHN